MAHVNTTLVEQVPDVSMRQRKPYIEHDSQTNDLWAGFEVAEWGAYGHPAKEDPATVRLKHGSSDSTYRWDSS